MICEQTPHKHSYNFASLNFQTTTSNALYSLHCFDNTTTFHPSKQQQNNYEKDEKHL